MYTLPALSTPPAQHIQHSTSSLVTNRGAHESEWTNPLLPKIHAMCNHAAAAGSLQRQFSSFVAPKLWQAYRYRCRESERPLPSSSLLLLQHAHPHACSAMNAALEAAL